MLFKETFSFLFVTGRSVDHLLLALVEVVIKFSSGFSLRSLRVRKGCDRSISCGYTMIVRTQLPTLTRNPKTVLRPFDHGEPPRVRRGECDSIRGVRMSKSSRWVQFVGRPAVLDVRLAVVIDEIDSGALRKEDMRGKKTCDFMWERRRSHSSPRSS